MKTGVYTITNLINGKYYVGGTEDDFDVRKRSHFGQLKRNVHRNGHLQNSFNKYGEENFIFEILEETLPEFAISQEQYWKNMLCSINPKYGYDICPVAGNTTGRFHSDESKLKMSNAKKEYHKNNPGIQKGKILSKEHCDNISKSRLGRFSGENNNFFGKKHTDKSKKTMSLNKTGVKASDETKLKMKLSRIGKKHSLETKKKIKNSDNSSFFKKGEKRTQESINKGNLKRYKAVERYSLDDVFIDEFISVLHASKELGFDKSCISQCCTGSLKTSKGFKWKYKNNN